MKQLHSSAEEELQGLKKQKAFDSVQQSKKLKIKTNFLAFCPYSLFLVKARASLHTPERVWAFSSPYRGANHHVQQGDAFNPGG